MEKKERVKNHKIAHQRIIIEFYEDYYDYLPFLCTSNAFTLKLNWDYDLILFGNESFNPHTNIQLKFLGLFFCLKQNYDKAQNFLSSYG